jgi:tetratricopeptide (TPR) repeat protein
MPFGRKTDASGRTTDFDRVYAEIIKPAIAQNGMEPIRADEERVGGSIHKPMYERLILCDYAIADITGANPNVYYELGIRHAVRPRSTVLLFAEGTLLPFDVAPLRGMAYRTDASGAPADAAHDEQAVAQRLREARAHEADDSPLFQLIEGMPRLEIDHAKTDIFRERVAYSQDYKTRLADARRADGLRDKPTRQRAVRAVATEPALAALQDVEAGIVIDLFLSLRDVELYQDMIDLYARMPRPLQQTRMVQEQRGFALNRLGRREEAAQVLQDIIARQGPSSETNGLLGRVYKDHWKDARQAGDRLSARGFLKKAIEAYVAGFEADWRDTYPGINALTLMVIADPPDPRLAHLLPVVRYAALHRLREHGTYWDYATMLELAVLAGHEDEALDAAAAAAAAAQHAWELTTTLETLAEMIGARTKRDETVDWIVDIEQSLMSKRDRLNAATKPVAPA